MLKKCAAGERPIRLQDAEKFDLINSLAGGPPNNEEAMTARRLEALAGEPDLGLDPGRFIERAVDDLGKACRAIEFGKGDLKDLHQLYKEIHKAESALLEAITVREAEASRTQERRTGDDTGPRLVRQG
jgi:hypothetical protein